MSNFKTFKSIIFIAILLALAGFLIVKFSSTAKEENVFADTNIPSTQEFIPAISNSPQNDSTRVYKNLDLSATVQDFDKRIYVLDQYFAQYKSPLFGTAKLFVDACTKFGAPKDCTTVAAIAMNETHLCTYSNSAEMHNCWGFGGPDSFRQSFPTFKDGIETVTNVLATQYGPQYMIDPTKMESTFCGPDASCVGWGNKIKILMDQINDLSKDLGMGDLYILR